MPCVSLVCLIILECQSLRVLISVWLSGYDSKSRSFAISSISFFPYHFRKLRTGSSRPSRRSSINETLDREFLHLRMVLLVEKPDPSSKLSCHWGFLLIFGVPPDFKFVSHAQPEASGAGKGKLALLEHCSQRPIHQIVPYRAINSGSDDGRSIFSPPSTVDEEWLRKVCNDTITSSCEGHLLGKHTSLS